MAPVARRLQDALVHGVLGPVALPPPSLREELRHLQEEASAARVQLQGVSGAEGHSLLAQLESQQRQVEEELARQDRQLDRALLAAGVLLASMATLYAALMLHQAGL